MLSTALPLSLSCSLSRSFLLPLRISNWKWLGGFIWGLAPVEIRALHVTRVGRAGVTRNYETTDDAHHHHNDVHHDVAARRITVSVWLEGLHSTYKTNSSRALGCVSRNYFKLFHNQLLNLVHTTKTKKKVMCTFVYLTKWATNYNKVQRNEPCRWIVKSSSLHKFTIIYDTLLDTGWLQSVPKKYYFFS